MPERRLQRCRLVSQKFSESTDLLGMYSGTFSSRVLMIFDVSNGFESRIVETDHEKLRLDQFSPIKNWAEEQPIKTYENETAMDRRTLCIRDPCGREPLYDRGKWGRHLHFTFRRDKHSILEHQGNFRN